MTALLLGQRGVPTTVLEREAEPAELSTRSYTIVLKETRGIKALAAAGCLEAAKHHSIPREATVFLDGVTGEEKLLPKRENMMGFSRPGLVRCLKEEIKKLPNKDIVTIRRGVLVKSMEINDDTNKEDTVISVHIKDKDNNEEEEILTATHLVGADGKWSQVRHTFADDEFSGTFSIRTEPSFGISLMCPSVPEGFRTDATYLVKPIHADSNFYIIAAPISTGEFSASIVCYDDTVEKYPWMDPPVSSSSSPQNSTGSTTTTWGKDAEANDSEDTTTLAEHLAKLLQDEAPYFYNAIGRDVVKDARIQQRVGWVELTANKNDYDEEEEVEASYASSNGRIVLIGDSAHAVTPSIGDGCNLALESAVELVTRSLSLPAKNNGVTIEDLTDAFRLYGTSRPPEVQPIQMKSAQTSRLPKKR